MPPHSLQSTEWPPSSPDSSSPSSAPSLTSPSPSDLQAPRSAPPKKPLPPPPPPPRHSNRSIAIEGVVFCKSCPHLPHHVESIHIAPLRGAAARLVCLEKKEKRRLEATAVTDQRGFFLLRAGHRAASLKRCRVYVSSPKWCNKPIVPAHEPFGVIPRFERTLLFGSDVVDLYAAGFFEFGSDRTGSCPR
ncbi:hypothetical protein HPP92_006053 [Vanilla planifolia]|uniref:Uncharacterized protein n=1 Tax=Vanilla planifolia TaxID=51239 RepID=A0A835RT82_VANPL|nr:hypothetical protein HPP92_006053 [Vanilla planifolia]